MNVASAMPQPHPLDFDWRYEQSTVGYIESLLSTDGPVLALGAPSVARALEENGKEVLLIDRQPCQGVRNHLAIEISQPLPPIPVMKGAIVDPPWYPDDFLEWTALAARSVAIGASVFVSVWPSSTRPTAELERMKVMQEISRWGDVTEHQRMLLYSVPGFEQQAISAGGPLQLSMSPRTGLLVELKVGARPPIFKWHTRRDKWYRFIVDDYQLAVRCGPRKSMTECIRPHPEANGWIWPYVSLRAPGLDNIDLWSSMGECAIVNDCSPLVQALRGAFKAHSTNTFEASLAAFAELLDWSIPRPPFKRVIEWHHPQ